MSFATRHITRALKAARRDKGLSQRDLSAKTGIPQSHISKIESGAVDLRLSSLIEFARMLDLEVTLVPRKLVPAVQSLIRSATGVSEPSSPGEGDALADTGLAQVLPARPAYSLDEEDDDA
jgi:transcriptional regulator with XRE-family HTH domain